MPNWEPVAELRYSPNKPTHRSIIAEPWSFGELIEYLISSKTAKASYANKFSETDYTKERSRRYRLNDVFIHTIKEIQYTLTYEPGKLKEPVPDNFEPWSTLAKKLIYYKWGDWTDLDWLKEIPAIIGLGLLETDPNHLSITDELIEAILILCAERGNVFKNLYPAPYEIYELDLAPKVLSLLNRLPDAILIRMVFDKRTVDPDTIPGVSYNSDYTGCILNANQSFRQCLLDILQERGISENTINAEYSSEESE